MTPEPPLIIADTWFGLCNRLKVIAAGQRLAAATGRRFAFTWPCTTAGTQTLDLACNRPWSTLFEAPDDALRLEEAEVRRIKGRRVLVEGERVDPADEAPAIVLSRQWRFVPLVGEPLIDLDYGDAPEVQALRAELLPYVQAITPTAEFRTIIEGFAQDHGLGASSVGLHIRRTDHAAARATSTDEAFCAALDAALEAGLASGQPVERVFVATDDPPTEALLRARYGDRVVTRAKASLDRRDPEAIGDALIDLMLLARCGALIGSAGSSFTELAWWLGGCEAPITIAGQPT